MKECHGCKGLGWVDSKHYGPSVCPICGGKGQIEANNPIQISESKGRLLDVEIMPRMNKNKLLVELEEWLRQSEGANFDHTNKRMNTYTSYSEKQSTVIGLCWVYTDGANRIHLRKPDYTAVDVDKRVLYKTSIGTDLFGGYPQFIVQTPNDLEYAKKLITYAIKYL